MRVNMSNIRHQLVANALFSGFKTNAVTRSNIFIPPGLVDIVITLSRGNLVKTFAIVATIGICTFNYYMGQTLIISYSQG